MTSADLIREANAWRYKALTSGDIADHAIADFWLRVAFERAGRALQEKQK